MTYFHNLDENLAYLESVSAADQRELVALYAASSEPGEVFAADVFDCREFIAPAQGDPERIEAAMRGAGKLGSRWNAALGDESYGRAVIRTALERWSSTAREAGNAPEAKEAVAGMPEAVNGTRICSQRASAVRKSSVDWLWMWRLAFGHVAVIDGNPGIGKSTIACDIVARFTRGNSMPGEEAPVIEAPRKRKGANANACSLSLLADAEVITGALTAPSKTSPGFAVIVSAEDNQSTGIVPRLIAAGADLDRVEIVNEVQVSTADGGIFARQLLLPNDLSALEAIIRRTGARLLIIDPLMAFIGDDRRGRQIDSHKDQSIRQLMYELRRLAERMGICIIIIRHITKSASTSALKRGSGSIGIAGAARSVLLAAEHPETSGACALAGVKSNIAPLPRTLAYRVLTSEEGASRIDWLDECDFSADDLLRIRPSESKTPARQREARQFIEEILKDGAKSAAEVLKRAQERGLSTSTLDRASQAVGVKHARRRGQWFWELESPPLDSFSDFAPL